MVSMARVADTLGKTLAAVGILSAAAITVGVVAFGLGAPFATALFFTLWWTLLFVVLPFAVGSQAEAGQVAEGTDPGAPSAPLLREKAIWTTLVAAPVFVAVSAVLPLVGL